MFDLFHPQKELPQQIEEWKRQLRLLSEREREEGANLIVLRLINHIAAMEKETQQPDELPQKERCIADDQWAIDAFYKGYDKANADFNANGYTGLKPIIGGIRSLVDACKPKRESGNWQTGCVKCGHVFDGHFPNCKYFSAKIEAESSKP